MDGVSSLESMLLPNNTIPGELPCQVLPDAAGIDWLSDEDLDSLAVRREMAAASIAVLGDFWDNEVDCAWQDFTPEVG